MEVGVNLYYGLLNKVLSCFFRFVEIIGEWKKLKKEKIEREWIIWIYIALTLIHTKIEY